MRVPSGFGFSDSGVFSMAFFGGSDSVCVCDSSFGKRGKIGLRFLRMGMRMGSVR